MDKKEENSLTSIKNSFDEKRKILDKLTDFFDSEITDAITSETEKTSAMELFVGQMHGVFCRERNYRRLRLHLLGIIYEEDYDYKKVDVRLSREWADELFLSLKNLPDDEKQRITQEMKSQGII